MTSAAGDALEQLNANGLPSSQDIVDQGIQAGTDWLAKSLKIPDSVANVVAAIVDVPAELFAGYVGGTLVASTAIELASGVASVVAAFAPAAAASLVAAVGAAAVAVPVLGEVFAGMALVAEFIQAIEGPPTVGVQGPAGHVTLDVSYYTGTAVPQAAKDAPKYLTMDVNAFAVQETVFVDDLRVATALAGTPFTGGNPTQLLPAGTGIALPNTVIVPGALSLLHAAQLSAASAAAPLVANILRLYVLVLGPSRLPLVTAAEWQQIGAGAQPVQDAIVANAQKWANSQHVRPTDDELNNRYGLLPPDRIAIRDAWKGPPAFSRGLKLAAPKAAAPPAFSRGLTLAAPKAAAPPQQRAAAASNTSNAAAITPAVSSGGGAMAAVAVAGLGLALLALKGR